MTEAKAAIRGTNVLLTCAGRKSYLVDIFERSDHLGTLVAVDSDPTATIQFRTDEFHIVPPLASRPEDYVDRLLQLCAAHRIDCVIPQNDLDLVLLAEARPRFREAGTEVLGAPPGVVRNVQDKLRMSAWMRDRHLPYPPTWSPRDTPIEALPALVKSRHGQGSAGLRTLVTAAELDTVAEKDVITQRKIAGREFNLDVLRSEDGVLSVVPKEKLEMRFGSTHKAVSVEHDELIDLGISIGDATQHIGGIDIDVMMDGEERLWVLDINPRLGGGFPFTALFCPRYVDALLELGRGGNPESFHREFEAGRRGDRAFTFFSAEPPSPQG